MTLTGLFIDLLEMEEHLLPLLLLALGVRLLLKKAPASCACLLWWGVFLRLACPFFLPAPVPAQTPIANALPAAVPAPLPLLPAGEAAPLVIGMSEPVSRFPFDIRLLAVLWALGLAGILLWNLLAYLRFRRCFVGAVRLRDNIWLGDDIPVPVVTGLFRPRIYLPSALEGQEQRYVILHEETHIRRKDPLLKLLASLLLAVHWFDPLVWIAFLWASRDMEAACDEQVLARLGDGIRREYSASILTLAAGRRIPVGPLAFGEGGEVKGRIRRVLDYRRPPRWARGAALGAVAVVLAAALLLPDTAQAVPAPPQGSVSQEPVSQGTITFPAYQDGREDYNAAVYDITPFRVALALPEGWSVRVPPAESRGPAFGFTPLWLYQGEEYAGRIQYNTFELYPDVSPDRFYRMVYNQLMLGSVVSWDNDYTVVRELASGDIATVQIMERQGDAASPTENRPGILAYDRDRLVYVAIDLENGRLSSQEVLDLAVSLEFLPGE